jgi:uncharacterized protein GlcG (DUF336 family)
MASNNREDLVMLKKTTFACAMALGLGLALAVPSHSQVVMQPNVSLELAREIADAALEACHSLGFDTSVAVVDRAGDTIVLYRATTSTPQTAEMARRKAYTARMWRRTSQEWAAQTLADPDRFPQRDLVDVIALSGGVPIKLGDETIGGVGSAGSNLQQDNDCAQAGFDAVAAQLQ